MSVTYCTIRTGRSYQMLTVQVAPGLMDLLKAKAFKEDRSVSSIVEELIQERFKVSRGR